MNTQRIFLRGHLANLGTLLAEGRISREEYHRRLEALVMEAGQAQTDGSSRQAGSEAERYG